jgi:antitoxin MazE
MQATIKKWGNSPALRLSSAIMKSAKLNVDQEVTIHVQRGKIVIEPSTPSEFLLGDLIAQITTKNLHTEVDFGAPAGREIW